MTSYGLSASMVQAPLDVLATSPVMSTVRNERLIAAAIRTSSATTSTRIPGRYADSHESTMRARGALTLHTKTYPLDAAADALDDLDVGNVRGRAILVP